MKVYRIDIAGSIWELLGQSIYGDNADDLFGKSVDISPDVNTIAVGSSQSEGQGQGYVRVFSLVGRDNSGDAGNWTQIGQDITGEAIGDGFGSSVSLSDDGKTIAVGAPFANGLSGDDSGHVSVYQLSDSESVWMQFGEDIDGGEYGDLSGYSVSLSRDGNTVAIGSPFYSDYRVDGASTTGQVRVFMVK